MLVLVTASLAVLAAACGSSASSQAAQACRYVHSSLTLYDESVKAAKAGDSRTARNDSAQALADLRLALPLAAQAAGSDGDWQPLMANLSESNRVPEKNLVHALTQQCAGVR